jgi:hemoglobin
MSETPSLPPRFPITEAEIDRVVAAFYDAVRRHPGLGPVFAAHVADWPEHEARVASFWRNVIFGSRVYEGNPAAVHRDAGDVRPGMFGPWLMLFDATLRRELRAEQAEAWSALAHRIGRTLRAAVVEREILDGGVPKLR